MVTAGSKGCGGLLAGVKQIHSSDRPTVPHHRRCPHSVVYQHLERLPCCVCCLSGQCSTPELHCTTIGGDRSRLLTVCGNFASRNAPQTLEGRGMAWARKRPGFMASEIKAIFLSGMGTSSTVCATRNFSSSSSPCMGTCAIIGWLHQSQQNYISPSETPIAVPRIFPEPSK
jgi:hypothetical protein